MGGHSISGDAEYVWEGETVNRAEAALYRWY